MQSATALIMNIKGMRIWDVIIRNNYYSGRYTEWCGRGYPVISNSAAAAKQVVLLHADAILTDLKSKRYHNGRLILPAKTAVPIIEENILLVADSTLTSKRSTYNFTPCFAKQGLYLVKLKDGYIIDTK